MFVIEDFSIQEGLCTHVVVVVVSSFFHEHFKRAHTYIHIHTNSAEDLTPAIMMMMMMNRVTYTTL